MVVSIGYPIGITKTDEGYYYTIETKDKYIHLSYEELQVWSLVDSSYIPHAENELKMVQRLESSGVLLSADTKKDILTTVLPRCYVRQGFGMLNTDGYCVHIGDKVINLTKRQMILWQLGNGNNKLAQAIAYCLREMVVSKDRLSDMVDDLTYLIDSELIYIIRNHPF